MANPRKFSDKIALHTQKQAEETAAFEAIIKEVSATTKKPMTQQVQAQQQQKQPVQQQHLQLIQPNFGAYRGHSLPNVNQVANNSIDLQGALSGLADIRQAVSGQLLPDKHRDRGHQSQKKFSLDRHRDCSPYGSVSYLSPPSDTSWRRASSDSALHSTVQQGGTTNPFGPGAVTTNRQAEGNLLQVGQVPGMEGLQMWDAKGLRPRSCDVPGISIYPSPDPGSSVLISGNTGSLPDLANLDFPSPLTAPLDSDVSLSQLCSSQDGGVLDNCVPPINITLQLYQQMADQQQQQSQVQAQGLPMASSGLQRHMVPAPLILQGSNGFIMGGGGAVLTQDNTYHRPMIPDKPFPDCRSPPAYSSLHPPNSCPLSPPLITLTDVTQGGGAADKILFSEFEMGDGYYQTNGGWCEMSGQSNFPLRHPAEYPLGGRTQTFAETGAKSTSTEVPRHRNAPQKPSSPERNSFYPSPVNSKRTAVSDVEMQNGSLMKNYENVKMDERESRDKHLGMAPFRGAPSDGPQSPNSPLSQPSSSYSPSQSPGTSASMASSPQMPDPGYQQDVVMAQVPYAFSQQQQGQSSGTASQQTQTQQPQQLARSVGNTALPSDSLQHKFQQIKVEDSVNAANLRTAVQQHLQQQQLQHELQQLQQQQQQQQLQQQQHAAAAAALMSSGNLVFMRTAPDQTPVVVGSIAPTSFYQSVSTQQALASSQSQQQQQQQDLLRQLQGPYVAGNQGFATSTGNHPQSVQFPLPSSSNAIPDIVLTAADFSLYANQAMMDFKNTGDEPIHRPPSSLSHSDSLSRDAATLLSYLGDSFDADMLTTDDFLKIGLDPLELEEIRMLSDANIVADPATEDSFRLDRM